MDENMEKQPVEAAAEEESSYIPRPAWQVWGARIALVLFLIVMLSRIFRMAQGIL
jgi:hypothetical protein